jgi:hypothetical protein
VQGSSCNDGNPFTSGDVLNGSCVCQGTFGPGNNWTLTVNTDAAATDLSWQILEDGTANVLASGGPYPPNTTNTPSFFVPDNLCWDLVFTDANCDGEVIPGGWMLKDHLARRVIDNLNNAAAMGCSATPNLPFCSPLGGDKLTVASCDREDWLSTEFIVAHPNEDVSAEWTVGDQTDDGYQFWFQNPLGGYSRRITHTHADAMGFGPPSATRACHMPLTFVTNPLPFNVLLNVRVRSIVNGVYSAYGPPAASSC